MKQRPSLRERKQKQAREQIVEAAFELFAERGFADVTVTEIAERAEVGRTTFFRYFGDKQEGLFAEEQNLLDGLRSAPPPAPGPPSFREAIEEARVAVEVMCRAVTADRERYRLHLKLVADNEELQAGGGGRLLNLTDAMGSGLPARGMAPAEAALAAHVALA